MEGTVTKEAKSKLDLVEKGLLAFELSEIIKKEKKDYSLLHPQEGAIITSTTFIIAPLRSVRDEADLASFAEKIKKAISIETDGEQRARATPMNVYIPILYFDEKVGSKRSEHRMEIDDEQARIALKDIVRRDMDAVRYATGPGRDDLGDDREGYSIKELTILDDERALKRRVIVKIYLDLYTAKAAASNLLKSAHQVERPEAEKFRALFKFPSSRTIA